jgi:hypothetical protein
MITPAQSQINWLSGFHQEDFKKFRSIRTHYGPWQPCWISDQRQKQKLLADRKFKMAAMT